MPRPTFIVVGERRCGTTTLHHLLQGHPDVWIYQKADNNYFIEDEVVGRKPFLGKADAEAWEATHSVEDYHSLFRGATTQAAIGHKGPDLFFWQESHQRIQRYAPDIQLILILRNPVKRAWSHYWNEVGKGRETLSFSKAINAEPDRIASSDYARDHLSYASRGFYAQSLKKFRETFPESRTHILILEDYFSSPAEFCQQLGSALGVDPALLQKGGAQQVNQNWTMVKKDWVQKSPIFQKADAAYARLIEPIVVRRHQGAEERRAMRARLQRVFRKSAGELKMPDGIKKQLQQLYAADTQELETLLGRKLDAWK